MTEAAIALAAGEARLAIARHGAEATAWSVDGVELLWPSDPAIWGEISPILDPVVGWTRDGARVGGRCYPLRLHGFASGEDFAVESAGDAFARLALRDNARTRALYPFAFEFAVEYRLAGAALEITLEIANPGDAPAPYACGLHPGFRWPFAGAERAGALVRFEKDEPAHVPAIAQGGLISQKSARFAQKAKCCRGRRTLCRRRLVFPRAGEPLAAGPNRPTALASKWISAASAWPRCGRGPARRSSASRRGPATAIR